MVSGDRLVEVVGGGADEGGEVLGFEIKLWRRLGAGEFALHLLAGGGDEPAFDDDQRQSPRRCADSGSSVPATY